MLFHFGCMKQTIPTAFREFREYLFLFFPLFLSSPSLPLPLFFFFLPSILQNREKKRIKPKNKKKKKLKKKIFHKLKTSKLNGGIRDHSTNIQVHSPKKPMKGKGREKERRKGKEKERKRKGKEKERKRKGKGKEKGEKRKEKGAREKEIQG